MRLPVKQLITIPSWKCHFSAVRQISSNIVESSRFANSQLLRKNIFIPIRLPFDLVPNEVSISCQGSEGRSRTTATCHPFRVAFKLVKGPSRQHHAGIDYSPKIPIPPSRLQEYSLTNPLFVFLRLGTLDLRSSTESLLSVLSLLSYIITRVSIPGSQ